MGYDIVNISEIGIISFAKTKGNKFTARQSVAKNKFIIEGDEVTAYTHAEMYAIVQTIEWNKPIL